MAEATSLSDRKAQLIAESELQRDLFRQRCQDMEFVASLVEKGHQVAFTALQARRRLNPFKSLVSKKSWLSVSGLFQNVQTLMGLVGSVRSALAPRTPVYVEYEEDYDEDTEIEPTRRF